MQLTQLQSCANAAKLSNLPDRARCWGHAAESKLLVALYCVPGLALTSDTDQLCIWPSLLFHKSGQRSNSLFASDCV